MLRADDDAPRDLRVVSRLRQRGVQPVLRRRGEDAHVGVGQLGKFESPLPRAADTPPTVQRGEGNGRRRALPRGMGARRARRRRGRLAEGVMSQARRLRPLGRRREARVRRKGARRRGRNGRRRAARLLGTQPREPREPPGHADTTHAPGVRRVEL